MKPAHIFSLCLVAFALAACGNAREQLGLNRKSPDEFAVVKHAPLAMPPSYNLRPPRPGAPRPQEQSTIEQARQTVFGEDAPEQQTRYAPADSEMLLLQQAGTQIADPDIRDKVDAETEGMGDSNKPVAEKLLGIVGVEDEPSATVVDAAEEAERIRKNREEGRPVTEGETPYIEQ